MTIDGLEPDAAREDIPWLRLLPWLPNTDLLETARLTRLGPPDDWWDRETPRVTAARCGYGRIGAVLAEVILDGRPTWSFQRLLPLFPSGLRVTDLPSLPTRACNALSRIDARTLGDLAEASPQDLFDLAYVGRLTVLEILAALVNVSVHGPVEPPHANSGPLGGDGAASPQTGAELAVKRGDIALLNDLVEIARWRHLRGAGDSPMLLPVLDDAAPEPVIAAQERLAKLTAGDLLPAAPAVDPVDELDALLFALPDRERFILARRFLARQPDKLDTLGEHLGLTRERVRQIEARLRAELAEATAYGSAAGDLLAILRAEIRPVTPLDRLLSQYPVLVREVTAVNAPLWLILDRIDDAFEVRDNWAAAPTVAAAVERTRRTLEDLDDQYGLVPLKIANEELGRTLDVDEAARWLSYCGYEIHDDHVLTRTRSIPDRAAAVLALTGKPLTFDDLVQRLGTGRSPTSIRNALYADSRFTRVDREMWALADWGLDSYTGIRALIGQELDRNGGEIKLDVLVDSLTRRFTMSESSVIAYASSPPYDVRGGAVRYRTEERTTRKDPRDTRRLYHVDLAWLYRLSVTREHLRGSGFPVPVGVATLVGCVPGRSVTLDSPLGEQPIRWTGTQPVVGTIRRHLERIAASEGDLVFLRLGDGTFDVVPADSRWRTGSPLERALAMVGADPSAADDVGIALRTMAATVCLPTHAEASSVLAAFRDRGDQDLYELLVQAWETLTSVQPTRPRASPATDKDPTNDVMRLLGYE